MTHHDEPFLLCSYRQGTEGSSVSDATLLVLHQNLITALILALTYKAGSVLLYSDFRKLHLLLWGNYGCDQSNTIIHLIYR